MGLVLEVFECYVFGCCDDVCCKGICIDVVVVICDGCLVYECYVGLSCVEILYFIWLVSKSLFVMLFGVVEGEGCF